MPTDVVTPNLWTFLTAAIPAMVTVITYLKSKGVILKGDERSEVREEKLNEIKVLVNGGLKEAREEIVTLQAEIVGLKSALATALAVRQKLRRKKVL